MKTFSVDLPVMYGDHHVTEVRRLLLEISGVEDVYASSSFRVIEATYDESKVKEDQLTAKLEESAYLGELPVSVEITTGAYTAKLEGTDEPFIRHTAAFEKSGKVVNFTQDVAQPSRPLWPCPGMGVIKVGDAD